MSKIMIKRRARYLKIKMMGNNHNNRLILWMFNGQVLNGSRNGKRP
jgi:hypothetical protein